MMPMTASPSEASHPIDRAMIHAASSPSSRIASSEAAQLASFTAPAHFLALATSQSEEFSPSAALASFSQASGDQDVGMRRGCPWTCLVSKGARVRGSLPALVKYRVMLSMS
jgi:hypothetical protein